MMTMAGCTLPISFCTSARVVSKVVKPTSPEAWSWTQATLLYLPRSIARLVDLDAVLVIVFIWKLLVGVLGFERVVTFRLRRPHAWILSAASRLSHSAPLLAPGIQFFATLLLTLT